MAIEVLSADEIDAVGGGYVGLLRGIATFLAGHVAGKLIDKMDGGANGAEFQMTPGLEALVAGNMTA